MVAETRRTLQKGLGENKWQQGQLLDEPNQHDLVVFPSIFPFFGYFVAFLICLVLQTDCLRLTSG